LSRTAEVELRNRGSTLCTKYLASFRFWFTDNYAVLQRIISEQKFSLLPLPRAIHCG